MNFQCDYISALLRSVYIIYYVLFPNCFITESTKKERCVFYPLFPYSFIFLTLPLSTRCTGKITFFCAISSFRSCAKIISVAKVPFFSES